ncbi:uncharacterized protein BP5553_05708 [Venustampulla echinocandica]|uniref:Xylanolytic transcriptional activator regulatory domain-containing protein n=1 Tax=Venustampulla echinocandica TaxID=2656787 RepID=A0A370TLE7_9HELO|nr:uncharacterized protein BP5553_05708 [Venustampulla echinocandica]RDL36356.1 hypothetical protein BP5553_05708 [Venustampulla echinocandica]
MQNRLRHLESLVKDVMSAQSPNQQLTSSPMGVADTSNTSIEIESQSNRRLSDNVQSPHQSGQVLVGSKEATYVGATHWAAILENIEEVKDYFEGMDTEDTDETENITPYASLTFNSQPTSSKNDLLAALPEKFVVDRLISQYFNSNSPSLPILHKPTFQKMYISFWESPAEAQVNWLGLLFALMSMATIASLHPGGRQPDSSSTPLETVRLYRNCCIQALILSNYTKPGPYTIETLLLFMEGEFILSADDQVHLYLLVGNVVRLSLRMGLHRDSANVGGNITPFQAEFRRRLWHHLAQIDLLSSFLLGLPGMVEAIASDTRYPRNLRDEDFREDSVKLPPSRPESELTPTTYLICKSRLGHECGKVATLANNLALPYYEEVLTLDGLLREAYEKVPTFFRVSSSGFSITDSPGHVIKQFSLFLLFHKSRCMLHRKYVTKVGKNSEYLYSKNTALDASLELLKGQSMSYEAARPGGPLAHDRWFLSTISMHDFLLAAMIVCMKVIQSAKEGLNTSNISDSNHQEDREMIIALGKSYKIWTEMGVNAADARKASSLLKSMLRKVDAALQRQPGYHGASVNGAGRANLISGLSLDDLLQSHDLPPPSTLASEVSQANVSNRTTPSSGLGPQYEDDSMAVPTEPFELLIDFPDNLDWENFDTSIFPKSGSDQSWPTSNLDDLSFGDFDYDVLGNN